MATERGFTLVEVLVALAIAAAALVAMRADVAMLGAARSAATTEEALARARSVLATVGTEQPVSPGVRQGDAGGGYLWRLEISPVPDLPVAGAASGRATILYDVAVAVGWSDAGRSRELVLRTRRVGGGGVP